MPERSDTNKNVIENDQPVLRSNSYLEVTYKQMKNGIGTYPFLLTKWLLDNVYKKSGRILDIGCGTGDHLTGFARLGFNSSGIDISPKSKELMPAFDIKIADLQKDPNPFSPQSFDFVFSKSVVEHMRQPECLLNCAFENLKPGGIAVIMTPSWIHNAWGPFYIDHTHVTPFTSVSLQNAMEIAGFQKVRVEHFYQLPFIWKMPFLNPIAKIISFLPIPYRPMHNAPWTENINKLIRFSNEVMLLGIGYKPSNTGE